MAIEPAIDIDPSNIMTDTTAAGSPLTVGGSDILMSTYFTNKLNCCRAICCQGTGTIGIKRLNDAGFTQYAVTPGYYIYGFILAVGSTSHGSSAGMTFIPEV